MTEKRSMQAPDLPDEWQARVRKDDLTAAVALIGSVAYLGVAVTGFAFWLGWLG